MNGCPKPSKASLKVLKGELSPRIFETQKKRNNYLIKSCWKLKFILEKQNHVFEKKI